MLWQEEEFKQICSRESLMEKAADIEKTIFVKEHERARYDFDLTMFYENRFWNQRQNPRENGSENRFLSRVRSAAKRECEP